MSRPNVVTLPKGGHGGGSNGTARITCPWCGVYTSGSAHPTALAHRLREKRYEWSFAFVCTDPACGRACLIGFEAETPAMSTNAEHKVWVSPTPRSTYAPDGVPAEIARDFREALDSRAGGFLYGAAVVGRRVLQAAVRSLVGDRGNLRTEIDALTSDQVPKPLRDAAHEVRFTGNDAAHADEVTEAECDDLLAFTERILDQIYVMPAQVLAAAARRAAKP